MTANGSGFLANPKTRQHAIVALLGCLLLLNAMTSVNERALFLPSGARPGAFAAIPEPGPVRPIGGTGFLPLPLPLRPALLTPPLAGIANPPTTLAPPVGAPEGIGIPAAPNAGAPVQAPAQSDAFTPDALNAPGSVGPGTAFNPAAPGAFFPGTAGAPGTPGSGTPGNPSTGTPGNGDNGGNGGTPTPVAALPEPTSWLLMIVGFFVMGGALRRRRSAGPAHA